MGNGTGQRPLSELSPMAQRRNSPSWNQTTKIMRSSSPFDSSPFNTSHSPRLFWQGRDSESSFQSLTGENAKPYDPEAPYSPSRRPSIEKLKRASRVKNSSIFAREQRHEYDPAHLRVLDRPLAGGRPFHGHAQSISQSPASPARQSGEDKVVELERSPKFNMQRPSSPVKGQVSPGKSLLSRATKFGNKNFDPESEIWSDGEEGPSPRRFCDDQSQSRNLKSVTFDAAPPQVNEYEMTTPDPSSIASESRQGSYEFDEDEVDISFDRGSSLDRDDSFDASLEDIEKTPVVLPEDWRFMSPASANDELVQGEEDPFLEEPGSPDSDALPTSTGESGMRQGRVESLDSNGERRPLPPLPSPKLQNQSPHPSPPAKLSAAFERCTSGQRVLPSPPGPASYSKTDITGMGRSSMSLEDRLKLMLQEHDEDNHSEVDRQRERRMRRAGGRERSSGLDSECNARQDGSTSHDINTHPHISRESILRNIKNNQDVSYEDSYEYSSQPDSSPTPLEYFDPDVPLPSLENHAAAEADVVVKEEQSDDEDIYAIPEYYGSYTHQFDVNGTYDDVDNDSQYSNHSNKDPYQIRRYSSRSGDGQTTPVPMSRSENGADCNSEVDQPENTTSIHTEVTGMKDFNSKEPMQETSLDTTNVFDFDLSCFRASLQRPITPEDQTGDVEDEPSTPESVIRHPISDNESSDEEPVPDPLATVKAPGAILKTRPSLTPADAQAMAAVRRKVSAQEPPMPSLGELDTGDRESPRQYDIAQLHKRPAEDRPPRLSLPDVAQRQSSLVKLDIPFGSTGESLEFGLDKEFDRVIEAQKVAFEHALSQRLYPSPLKSTQGDAAQMIGVMECVRSQDNIQTGSFLANGNHLKQRGYLMRQNTKVIIASSRNDDDPHPSIPQTGKECSNVKTAPPSPRKASQPTWTAEPWNGKMRRQSVKIAGGGIKKKPVAGAVPPLPGMPSNVQDIQAADESESLSTEQFEEGQERGRLFVKVVGVKDLDLPLPRGERLYFALTLDNGLHCVTTSWLELGKSAPIGQEFELIVQTELEFQLTLQMKVDGTMLKQTRDSMVSSSPGKVKTSAFSRVFASPKKRKEMELRQHLEQQQKQKADAKTTGPWDKLRTLVDRDGSFARAYVSLSDHEKYAFGRPYTVNVSCFNEWAMEEPSSLKSKKSSSINVAQKRPPYKIGNLELQLLYIPKPKAAKEDDMPKSMNACIREMREAENTAARAWEGFLSQQGGDCPYWRRRFFRLQGSKLTAYHEVTRQPRATINLAKAAKLIDDKSDLTRRETSTKGGGRRKSAFAEEEEGYMFVEEGFRIRFANGEVIDFYADSHSEKEGWMKVLSDTVGKGYAVSNGQVKGWTELVLRHERSMNAKRDAADRLLGNVPPSVAPKAQAPFQPPRPRHQHTLSQPDARALENRREKTRSLIF